MKKCLDSITGKLQYTQKLNFYTLYTVYQDYISPCIIFAFQSEALVHVYVSYTVGQNKSVQKTNVGDAFILLFR